MTSLFFLLPKNALPRADLGSRCPLMRGVQGRLPISSPSINATKMELWIFFLIWKKMFLKIILFIFGLLVAESRGYSLMWCAGFSSQWPLLLQSTGSRACGLSSCGSWALDQRLNCCGAGARLLRSMWDLPGSRIKPVSPALAGKFASEPPGKSLEKVVFVVSYSHHWRGRDFLP